MKVRLGDICEIQSGGTPSKSKQEYWNNGTIPWITTTALNGTHICEKDAIAWITKKAIEKSSAKIVPQESIMVGARVGIGKVAINSVEMSTSQDILSLTKIDEKLWSKDFICKFIISKNAYLISKSRGATIKGINLGTLSALELPNLPLLEQRDISQTLDKVDSVINSRQQQLTKLDELVKSRFMEMFGEQNNQHSQWPVVRFTDFAKIDGNRTTDYEKYANYPHIGIESIEKGTGCIKNYATVAEDNVSSSKYIFSPKHIIYSKIRPNLNKVALPTFYGLCSADAYPILPNPKNCDRIFLACVMRSNVFLNYILKFSSRTNLPKVNKKQVEGFQIPLPPLPLQQQFAAFVEKVDKSKFIVGNRLAGRLYRNLLTKLSLSEADYD